MSSPSIANNMLAERGSGQRLMEIRWSALRSRWQTEVDQCRTDLQSFFREDFVLVITLDNAGGGVVDAWVEAGHARSIVRHGVPVRCIHHESDGLFHLDATCDANSDCRPLLAVTVRVPVTLLFAQTPMLAEAGWAGGAYDPPRLQRFSLDEASLPTKRVPHASALRQ